MLGLPWQCVVLCKTGGIEPRLGDDGPSYVRSIRPRQGVHQDTQDEAAQDLVQHVEAQLGQVGPPLRSLCSLSQQNLVSNSDAYGFFVTFGGKSRAQDLAHFLA